MVGDLLAELSVLDLVLVFMALLLGGVVKGLTGAGAPILAVPMMASLVDLTFAVILMLVPNVVTNIRQTVQFRKDAPPRRFLIPYLGSGSLGVVLGAVALVKLPERPLELGVAVVVSAYIALRLLQPHWRLPSRLVQPLAAPAGALAGILQGATGISSPATLTFLSAASLPRRAFIATLAMLFLLFSVLHIAALLALGSYPLSLALLSVLALLPVLVGMELGSVLGRFLPPKAFERVVLLLLAAIVIKTIL